MACARPAGRAQGVGLPAARPISQPPNSVEREPWQRGSREPPELAVCRRVLRFNRQLAQLSAVASLRDDAAWNSAASASSNQFSGERWLRQMSVNTRLPPPSSGVFITAIQSAGARQRSRLSPWIAATTDATRPRGLAIRHSWRVGRGAALAAGHFHHGCPRRSSNVICSICLLRGFEPGADSGGGDEPGRSSRASCAGTQSSNQTQSGELHVVPQMSVPKQLWWRSRGSRPIGVAPSRAGCVRCVSRARVERWHPREDRRGSPRRATYCRRARLQRSIAARWRRWRRPSW